ncbi:MAG TPA: alkaline phosphatase, partial [Candidatus Ozemobacteraceae bacterium]|nr:alkaline phosphatase [Candidatus Ozemobacteraceae bacterium]
GNQLITIMDLARNKGMKTGIISDTRLTHATPAAFAGHVAHRDDEEKLAEQIVFAGIDVLMSGGRAWFQSVDQGGKQAKGRSLLADAEQQGYRMVQSRQDLVQALTDKAEKVLALFADSYMPFSFEPDFKTTPDLPEMTASALRLLSTHPKGFLLVVEAGQIDALAHAHDAAELVEQIREMDATVRVLQEFVRSRPDTLLVMVPDHSTGGIHMAERFQEDAFRKSAVSTKMLARRIGDAPETLAAELKRAFPALSFSEAELGALKPAPNDEEFEMKLGDLVWGKLGIYFLDTVQSLKQMSTNGHGCEDMFLHAMGAHQNLFQGVMNLTDIPRRIAAALQLGELR